MRWLSILVALVVGVALLLLLGNVFVGILHKFQLSGHGVPAHVGRP